MRREVQLRAVGNGEQGVAKREGAVSHLLDLGEGEDVAQRLRHLLLIDVEVLAVEPVADERLSGRTLALRDLVLVVREDQVDCAGVNVEGLAEEVHRHRGTLEVPSGAAFADRSLPRWFAFLLPLPEHEIPGALLLVLVGLDAAEVTRRVDLYSR